MLQSENAEIVCTSRIGWLEEWGGKKDFSVCTTGMVYLKHEFLENVLKTTKA